MSIASRTFVWLLVALSVGVAVPVRADEPVCKGNKIAFRGECLYPDEIDSIRAKEASQAEAERRAREAAVEREREEAARKEREAEERAQREAEQKRRAEPVVPEPVPPKPVPEPPPPPVEAQISPLVWIGAGLAGAGLVIGAITGGISFAQAKDIRERCGGDACPPAESDAIDEMTTLANVSNVNFALGAVGVLLGLIGVGLSDWSSDDVALHIGPGGAQITASF